MRQAIEKGLNKETHPQASVKCFPTYVRELPSGYECGKFLALDLGGTNFRVVLMEIGKDQKYIPHYIYNYQAVCNIFLKDI